MNINLTLFLQIFNILTMLFLLKKILIEKILEEINLKKTNSDNILNQINQKKESISNLSAEHASLWAKFKNKAIFSIENNNKTSNGQFTPCEPSEDKPFCDEIEKNGQIRQAVLIERTAKKIVKFIGDAK